MEKEELDKIIQSLTNNNAEDKASFGLYYGEGEDEDEMHIKANKEGFELFAAELLKASRDSETIINNTEKNYIDFEWRKEWMSGEMIAYIKPVSEARNEIKEDTTPHVESFKDKMFKYGCLSLIAIVVIGAVIGFYTIFRWLFGS
ncbi:hypothetical protein [Flavobacterium cerinum]|uniref:Uncharacterized protein n=1 Tax=Flavobacterium cerinum TaxID=2502784 RepID=A0ABY5IR35_9FLAO|nr:hypothetical protein [Flavobacterium cerinum]UUC44741.1 hypothetical protein NOX80_14020 [Flavobacterium cerinum]